MSRPGRFTPEKENLYPFHRRLCGLHELLDRCGKSRPTGIRSADSPGFSMWDAYVMCIIH